MLRNLLACTALLCLSFSSIALAGGHDQLCMQTHYGHKGWEPLSTMDKIQELGVGWIRDDLFWSSVEKEKGKYEIPEYAWEWLKAAKARELKVIVILNGGNKLYENQFDPEGYTGFARFVAQELKGYAHALELINEPFGHFRQNQPDLATTASDWNGWDRKAKEVEPWVYAYVRTMNSMADAIQEVAPNQYKVIGLGCAPPLNAHMLKIGISPNVDGMVLHPYSFRSIPELQAYGDTPSYLERDGITVGDEAGTFISINQDLLDLSAKHNGPKELWLTEQGYTTYWRTNPRASHYDGYTESAQAKYAQRRLMECLGTNVRLASWYNFYEKGTRPNNSEDHFGIMRRDGTLKPAYYAIQSVATTMQGWEADAWGSARAYFIGRSRDAMFGSGIRAYPFSKDDQRAMAIWTTQRAGGDLQPPTADVVIQSDRIATKITALDMITGATTEMPYKQDAHQITIEYMPVCDYPTLLVIEGTQPAGPAEDSPDYLTKGLTWDLQQADGAKATWEIQDGVATYTYAFQPTGPGYAGAAAKIGIAERGSIIRFQHKASAQTTILIRIYDSTGQSHQYKFGVAGSGQWVSAQLKLLDKLQTSFGGASDRKIHYPLTGLFLGNETSSGSKTGTIQFRDLKVQTP